MNETQHLQALLGQLSLGQINLNALSNADLAALKNILTPRMTEYIPHTPTSKQAAYMLLDCEEAFYGGSAGGGKLIPTTLPILTQTGWKTVGTLKITDRIIALDGSWTEIEYITPEQYCPINYEITFSCDNKIICNAEHLWTIEECQIVMHHHEKQTRWISKVLSTQQILDRGIYIKKNNKWQKAFRLPEFRGFEGTEQKLPIHPYFLGYWLGDGTSSRAEFTVGMLDIDAFFAAADRFGLNISSQYKQQGNAYALRCNRLIESLKRLRLVNNKHIPEIYKLASKEQRLWLLRGLMDSDGHAQERGRCEWSQMKARKRLFDDVCELLSGLGNKISITEAPSAFNGDSFPSWRVTFTPFEEVFYLKRKNMQLYDVLHQDPIKQRANLATYIESIEQVEPDIPMKCIRIKHPSHVFLVGKRFIPTHNSDALLMCALQYVDIPGYSAILFRKTYADLTKPGALMDRAKEWLLPFKNVRWDDKDKKFTFHKPGTKIPISTLQFGYMENANDRFNYQGGEYQFIGFDELTHIAKICYTYMFSRLRRLKGVRIPLRVRGASNPPEDDGGDWVRERFIVEGPSKGRIFIPAGLDDNPYLDKEEYEKTLEQLDPVTRARLRDGDWSVIRKGNMFKRNWFGFVDILPAYRRTVRWWDMASTDEEKAAKKNKSNDPDYTASLKVSEANGIYYIEDIIRVRRTPENTEVLQRNTAVADGYNVTIREEQEPGSSGVAIISSKSRSIFKGYNYSGIPSTGSKADRASIASAAASNGNIKILRNIRNIEEFFNELESFPGGMHDDMVDCLSGCVNYLGITTSTGTPIAVAQPDQASTWLEDDQTEYASGLNYFARFGK